MGHNRPSFWDNLPTFPRNPCEPHAAWGGTHHVVLTTDKVSGCESLVQPGNKMSRLPLSTHATCDINLNILTSTTAALSDLLVR